MVPRSSGQPSAPSPASTPTTAPKSPEKRPTAEPHPRRPRVERLTFVGKSVVRQFGLRAVIDLATGAGVAILLFVLGVDFPLMWGILTFFLSFVPYIGLVLAVAPAVLLALGKRLPHIVASGPINSNFTTGISFS
ncbi:MAG TPA: AI-2E family transporter [Rubrobacter sp.]|nr:AI-2E family transporter [Rubrobacter sp.]